MLVAVSIVFWLSLSFGGPFHLRLWGAMYPARLRGRVVGVLGMGRAAAGALAAFGGGVLADRIGGERAVAIAGVVGRGLRPRRTSGCALRPPSARRRSRRASRSGPSASGRSSARIALAQGFYGGGLIAAAPLYALVHVDRLNLSLSDVGVIGILAAIATTVAFPIWGVVADRHGPMHGAPPRQRDRARCRSSAYALAPSVVVLWLAALAAGTSSASIDVGYRRRRQRPHAAGVARRPRWPAGTR